MAVYEMDIDLASPYYRQHTDSILKDLIARRYTLVKALLHARPVYIVLDAALAKTIYGDERHFSMTPNDVAAAALPDNVRRFADDGLQQPVVAARRDQYKQARTLFNQALHAAYDEREAEVDALARRHAASLLDTVAGAPAAMAEVDIVALCRDYLLPVFAAIIGIDGLPCEQLAELARCAQVMVEGNGMQGSDDDLRMIGQAHARMTEIVSAAVERGGVREGTALHYLLAHSDRDTAIGYTRSFLLGGGDTTANALIWAIYLLATHSDVRDQFLALDSAAQRLACYELARWTPPAYYSPRFAVADTVIGDHAIPAGSFIQIAFSAFNRAAYSDIDLSRGQPDDNTLPFGHARHKCPGDHVARHLMAVFLNDFYGRFIVEEIKHATPACFSFTRTMGVLVMALGKKFV